MGRTYLGSLATMSEPRYSYRWSGGADVADWKWSAPPGIDPPAATIGRPVVLGVCPGTAWRGVLDQPERGNPWVMRATGLGKLTERYYAIADAGHRNAADHVNECVDNAIAAGLPLIRRDSLPATDGFILSGSKPLAELLDIVADDRGEWWNVDDDGVITMGPAPAAVTYLLQAADAPAPTYDEYATSLSVTYHDNVTLQDESLVVTDAAAVAAFGMIQRDLDITQREDITAAQATAIAQGRLAKQLPHPRWTEPFVVTYGQLLTPGGVPVDLAVVRPGCRVRPMLTDPGRSANLTPGLAITFLVEQTDFDGNALALTPVGTTDRSLAGTLARR